MTLTDDEVRSLADDVLGRSLGPRGFIEAEVRSGVDHDGEPALFVTAKFRLGSGPISGQEAIDARSALSDALLERGERRFPYLIHHYPGDARAPLNELQRKMRWLHERRSA